MLPWPFPVFKDRQWSVIRGLLVVEAVRFHSVTLWLRTAGHHQTGVKRTAGFCTPAASGVTDVLPSHAESAESLSACPALTEALLQALLSSAAQSWPQVSTVMSGHSWWCKFGFKRRSKVPQSVLKKTIHCEIRSIRKYKQHATMYYSRGAQHSIHYSLEIFCFIARVTGCISAQESLCWKPALHEQSYACRYYIVSLWYQVMACISISHTNTSGFNEMVIQVIQHVYIINRRSFVWTHLSITYVQT